MMVLSKLILYINVMMIAMIVKEQSDLGIRIFAYILVFGSPVCYFLRHQKPFDAIWRVLASFWIALGLVVGFHYIKDKLNDKK
jgi:hypothetical protein